MQKTPSSFASMYMCREGEVEMIITTQTRTGVSSLSLTASMDGPSLTLRDKDQNITGQWTLTANGRLRGYLIDRHGAYQYIPARPTRRPARATTPPRRAGRKG